MKLFKGQIQTGCGPASSEVGPFYCPADYTAYFDTDFFKVLETQFGSSGGPLAQEYVVAHEYGHHVQNPTGDLKKAHQGVQGAQGVRSELQADCYAGVWAHYASTTKQQGTGVPFLEPLSDKGHRRCTLGGILGRRRPYTGRDDRPGEPGELDPRFLRTTPEVVHRRLPDRRPQPMQHLQAAEPGLIDAATRDATRTARRCRPARRPRPFHRQRSRSGIPDSPAVPAGTDECPLRRILQRGLHSPW